MNVTRIRKWIEIIRWIILGRMKYKGEWFLCSRGIGDTTIFLSKLHEYKKKNPNKNIRLIISDTHLSIAKAYGQYIDDIATLPYKVLCKSSNIAINNWLPTNIRYILPSSSAKILGYKDIDISDLMNITLGLKSDTVNNPPNWLISQSFSKKIEMLKKKNKKIALVAPNAVSVSVTDVELWISICELLSQNGYLVLINSNNEMKGLSMYNHISYDLDETYFLAERCNIIISLRSGLCDLLGFTNSPMLVLYPDECSMRMYSMKHMGFSKEIEESLAKDALDVLNKMIRRD